MKRNLIAAMIASALICAASAAHAQFFSISADLPVQYKFDQGGSADDVSGFTAAVNLPFLVGFGYEDYSATLNNGAGAGISREVTFTIFDVFIDLPTPLINIGLGLGFGSAEIKDGAGSTETFDDASVFQYFVTIGLPFAEVFDVHIGYHALQGTADNKNAAGQDIDIDGNMLSLGLRIGF